MLDNTGVAVAPEIPIPEQQAPEPDPLSRATRLLDLSFVLLVALTFPFLGVYRYLLFGANPHATQADFDFRHLSAISFEAIALCTLAYVLYRRGQKVATLGLKIRWSDLPVAIGLFLAAYVVGGLTYWVVTRFLSLIQRAAMPAGDIPGLFAPSMSVLGLLFISLNPIFEELIVRAFFTLELKTLTGSLWLASACSVLLQTSYHLYQPLGNAVMIGAIFTVFAVYFAVTNRIIPIIIAHFFLDLAAYISYVK